MFNVGDDGKRLGVLDAVVAVVNVGHTVIGGAISGSESASGIRKDTRTVQRK